MAYQARGTGRSPPGRKKVEIRLMDAVEPARGCVGNQRPVRMVAMFYDGPDFVAKFDTSLKAAVQQGSWETRRD